MYENDLVDISKGIERDGVQQQLRSGLATQTSPVGDPRRGLSWILPQHGGAGGGGAWLEMAHVAAAGTQRSQGSEGDSTQAERGRLRDESQVESWVLGGEIQDGDRPRPTPTRHPTKTGVRSPVGDASPGNEPQDSPLTLARGREARGGGRADGAGRAARHQRELAVPALSPQGTRLTSRDASACPASRKGQSATRPEGWLPPRRGETESMGNSEQCSSKSEKPHVYLHLRSLKCHRVFSEQLRPTPSRVAGESE